MFWLIRIIKNVFHTVGIIVSTVLFYGCGSDTLSSAGGGERRFNIPAFFDREIKRLAAEDKEILKTVFTGDNGESKKVIINDWSKELSAFVTIDLNKPAYRGYVKKDSSSQQVTFRIDNPDLDVSEVIVHYNEQNIPTEIFIIRHIQNFLYTTREKLSYRKNKDYKIEKHQDVWMLGTNLYYIEGKFEE